LRARPTRSRVRGGSVPIPRQRGSGHSL